MSSPATSEEQIFGSARQVLSKYCALFMLLMAFLMALVLAISPSLDLSQTRMTNSA
jgi:multisubunit Na+/H+ antiporter MnhB subunit